MSRTGKYAYAALLPAALLAFPAASGSSYGLSLLTEILIFGVFTMSLDLLLGYTGLVSLGHAAFFGVGAYTAGFVALHVSHNIAATLPAALAASAMMALVIGWFSIRTLGVYFLMLTLAFSQMVYALAHKWKAVTGGSDGMAGIPRPSLGVPGVFTLSTADPVRLYFVVAALFLLCAWLLTRITGSPFGRSLVGIKENESRMRALGYNTRGYKLASFVLAGAFAGIAGAMYSYYNGFVSPAELHWGASGIVLVMVILGGAGTLFGPVLGAGLVLLLQNLASSYTGRWPTIMGVIFLLFVMFARRGIVGLYYAAAERVGSAWNR